MQSELTPLKSLLTHPLISRELEVDLVSQIAQINQSEEKNAEGDRLKFYLASFYMRRLIQICSKFRQVYKPSAYLEDLFDDALDALFFVINRIGLPHGFDLALGNRLSTFITRPICLRLKRNFANREKRLSKHKTLDVQDSRFWSHDPGPEDTVILTETISGVRAALATFPEDDRNLKIISRIYQNGESSVDIAAEMGCKKQNVGNLKNVGFKKLKPLLKKFSDQKG